MKRILNTIVLVIVAGAVVGLLTMWLRPKPTRVDTARAVRGPMEVTVDGEGKTRVRDRYVVGAPIAGRLRRITLRRGDAVVTGQVIAQIETLPLSPLDSRRRAEAIAQVNAVEDAKREAVQMADRYHASYEQSLRELQRSETLARSGVISREEAERARTAVTTRLREYEAAQAKAESAAHEVELARAALIASDRAESGRATASVKVRAPAAGKVLHLLEESERVISAGAPLIELSNPSRLEVVIELLSTDAVKVTPGALVWIESWGGPEALEARVRLIEPSAFTKVSALGIEEQRVNVVADLTEPSTVLGDGYRIEGRIVVWQVDNVLQVPVSALFRRGENWRVFVVENGEAQLREVEVGHRNSLEAEVKRGLEEGTQVIVHPSSQVTDGTRVEMQTPQAR